MVDQQAKAPPSREELWQVVEEARYYLTTYLNDPSSRVHPTAGKVVFDAMEWGRINTDGDICKVCLAGLWYLQKKGILLGQELKGLKGMPLPSIADFLDDLRYGADGSGRINEWLGIPIPEDLTNELLADTEEYWDGDEPSHILLFLDWLLEQRATGEVPNAK